MWGIDLIRKVFDSVLGIEEEAGAGVEGSGRDSDGCDVHNHVHVHARLHIHRRRAALHCSNCDSFVSWQQSEGL